MPVVFRRVAFQVLRMSVTCTTNFRTESTPDALHCEFDRGLRRTGGELFNDQPSELPTAELLVVLIEKRRLVDVQAGARDRDIGVAVAWRRRDNAFRSPLINPFFRRPAVEDMLFAGRFPPLVNLTGDRLQLRPRVCREAPPLRGVPLRTLKSRYGIAE